jgi:Holliday junction resolvase RusA-like endonuclease
MNTPIVHFVVPGIPVGKGRHRSRRAVGYDEHGQTRAFIAMHPDRKSAKYEKHVAIEAKIAMQGRRPVGEPVCLVVRAYYPIPSSWPQWRQRDARTGVIVPKVKPDWDNVGKAASDAMNGIVYTDDSLVVTGCVLKRYSTDPRVEIAVYAFVRNPDVRAAQVDPFGLAAETQGDL